MQAASGVVALGWPCGRNMAKRPCRGCRGRSAAAARSPRRLRRAGRRANSAASSSVPASPARTCVAPRWQRRSRAPSAICRRAVCSRQRRGRSRSVTTSPKMWKLGMPLRLGAREHRRHEGLPEFGVHMLARCRCGSRRSPKRSIQLPKMSIMPCDHARMFGEQIVEPDEIAVACELSPVNSRCCRGCDNRSDR